MVGAMNWNKNKTNQRIKKQLREEKLERKNDDMVDRVISEKANKELKLLSEDQKYEIYGSYYNSFGPCGPTRKSVINGKEPNKEVRCIHCGKQFKMLDMVFEYRFGESEPLWWCPKPTCDGAGYGFDIHPVSSKKKRRGLSIIGYVEQLNELKENE